MSDLKPCPFCGADAVVDSCKFDTGGDYQFLALVHCKNRDCHIKPGVNVRGEHGYRQQDDLPNDEAIRLAKWRWNKRSDSDN